MFLLVGAAHAFCGAYVGGEGEELSNYASEVVLARYGTRTTLTLVSDYTGDASNFALLLPLPVVIGPEDVNVVDPALLDWIDAYSVPREVEYTCDTLFSGSSWGCAPFGCSVGSDYYGYRDSGGVISWSEHGYDFVVLTAEESADLLGWLATNGYAVPAGGEAILQEYIDAGSYFLAAKVSLDGFHREGDWLWPIQVGYHSDVFSLPIRIGTISSQGMQDLVIYGLNDIADGEMAISNFDEFGLTEECMLEVGEDFGEWYPTFVETANPDGAGWVREYSWDLEPTIDSGYHCDPCTAEAIVPGGNFDVFGLPGTGAHLTRMHMRYTPEQATEDLTLYLNGITGAEQQVKVITGDEDLELFFPYCDRGWDPDPGECPGGPILASERGEPPPTLAIVGIGGLLTLALTRRNRR